MARALGQLQRQQQRLLDAYLAGVIGLTELQDKRQDLDRRHATLAAQQRQLDAITQRLELSAVADGIEAFCQTIRAELATATFEQRRQLAELLIDRVIVTDDQVEIRYVLPTAPAGHTALFASCGKTISSRHREVSRQHTSPAARSVREVSAWIWRVAPCRAGTRRVTCRRLTVCPLRGPSLMSSSGPVPRHSDAPIHAVDTC